MRKSVQVLSSDSERPSFPLQVSALVGAAPATLGIKPEGPVNFDRFPIDEPQKFTVELTNYSQEPMHLSIVGAPPEFLSAELSAEILEPRKTVELRLETRDRPPLGRFAAAVTLLLDEARNTRLTIPVSGTSMMK